MNLYKISQDINNDYDTYDSAIVAAETKEKAAFIHPGKKEEDWDGLTADWDEWVTWDNVEVELIGKTDKDAGVILASFNAR